ncbi:MAG TPA: AtpZ/AtpI family protein [Haliangiales bacterium]|nr:AtpZ/AtpI family protein [Haliangiales bacterium]
MQDPDSPSPFFKQARFASVGLEMGIAVAIGAGVGYLGDNHFGTKPWLSLIGLLIGVAAGFKGMIDAAKKAKRSLESSKPGEGEHDA